MENWVVLWGPFFFHPNMKIQGPLIKGMQFRYDLSNIYAYIRGMYICIYPIFPNETTRICVCVDDERLIPNFATKAQVLLFSISSICVELFHALMIPTISLHDQHLYV